MFEVLLLLGRKSSLRQRFFIAQFMEQVLKNNVFQSQKNSNTKSFLDSRFKIQRNLEEIQDTEGLLREKQLQILQVHLSPAQFCILFLKAESVGSFLTLSSRVFKSTLPLNHCDSCP